MLIVPSPENNEKKTSRRQFMKGGAILAVSAVALAVGAGDSDLANGEKTYLETVTTTATQSSHPTNTLTITTTNTQTATLTQTETLITTQTKSRVLTSTETVTEVQTQHITDGITQTITQFAAQSTTQTSSQNSASSIAAANSPFSVFWITDTQFLSETNPQTYIALTNWIVNNWSTFNGKLVIHTGDIVEHGNAQVEWENADAAMSVLAQNGIPYTWCAGNHDDMAGDDSSSGWSGNLWASSFDPNVVSQRMNSLPGVSWVGDAHNGMNTAVTFSANGINFLVINLEWNAQTSTLDWAKEILSNPEYAGYRVIIAPHAYIDSSGSALTSSNHVDLTDFVTTLTAMMDDNSSRVFLTLNGHYATDYGYNTTTPTNNRNSLMFDRQNSTDAPNAPAGRGIDDETTPDWVRMGGATVTLLTFDTPGNVIDVSTYDVFKGIWRTDEYEQYSIQMFPTSETG